MLIIGRIVSLCRSITRRLFERPITLAKSSVCLVDDRIVAYECTRDDVVLFDTENRSVYLLNHTAAEVVRLIDGTRSLGWISRKVALDFNEKTRVVTRDVKRIYRELLRKGVITMASDRSLIPRIKRETVIRQEDDGAFIFDPITDGLSAVNETGLLVLRQIDGKKSIDDIMSIVASRFSGVEPEDVRRDVEAFIEELANRGLIVV